MFKYRCPSAVVLVSEGGKYPSVFRTIYTQDMTKGPLRKKCPSVFLDRIFLYSVRIQENTDQKKLRIWTLFTQWALYNDRQFN